MNQKVKYFFQLMALITLAGTSNASVKFSGFASAGVITGDLETPFLSGQDLIGESSSFGADNTVGIQVAADINQQIYFATQLLGKGTVDSYSVSAQWAYITYKLSKRASVRLGRMNFPVTLFSEFQEIGFSYPWVRTPIEVYNIVPLSTFSGVDLLFTFDLAGINWQIQPFIGSSPGVDVLGISGDVEHAFGATIIAQLENGTLRITAAHVNEVNFEFSTLGTAANLNMDVTFFSAGIEYEKNNVLFISEFLKKDVHNSPKSDFNSISDMMGYYVTLGYRMGEFLPHFTYGDTRSDHRALILLEGSPFPGVPSTVWTAPEDFIIPSNTELFLQKSYVLGLRYNFSQETAIKLDYQKIIPDDGSWGVFLNDPGDSAELLSIAVDVIF